MASSEERDHTIIHSDRMRDPGDYYASKAADARTLREALQLAESRGDTAGAARIREALERADTCPRTLVRADICPRRNLRSLPLYWR